MSVGRYTMLPGAGFPGKLQPASPSNAASAKARAEASPHRLSSRVRALRSVRELRYLLATPRGRFSAVQTRFCRLPPSRQRFRKRPCDAANHHQLIRWSSSGLTYPIMWYSNPVHSSGPIMPPRTIGRRGSNGSIAPYRSPTSRHIVMCIASANREPSQAEMQHLLDCGSCRWRVQAACQQINRIPHTVVEDQSVERRQHCHGHSSGQVHP